MRQTVHLDSEPPAALVHLEPDRRFRPVCRVCGAKGTVHSAGLRRIVRDLSLGPAQTFLQVEYRRVGCARCGCAKVEELDFLDAHKRVTRRLAQYIYGLCKIMTVQDVARHLDLDPKCVKAIDKQRLAEEFAATDCEGLRILAVDEIALQSGQLGYMTVVMDYESGRVVWMGQGRNMATLDAFFAEMSPEQKEGIEAVAIDMWEPFINRIAHHCPQARIVFDLFHLVKGFGEVIDEVRREEVRKARGPMKKVVKGSRYLLLKNRCNLRAPQRVHLRELLAVNERLSAVYQLKDQLKMLYRYRYRAWAKRAIDQWCEMAAEIDHHAMHRFIGRLRFFEHGILNHCNYPIGTSPLEGVNNKIKVIKRKAYGFHDPHYFALKVKQALPGRKATTEMG